ncbi:radical SAM protein [Thermodesulfobacteriota bacterium]
MTSLGARPSTVHICITDRCNLSCRHCDIWKIRKKPELDLADWKGIIDNLHGWLGPFTLKFAGGEPLLCKHTLDLARYARKLGITVGINTNGTLLDEEKVKAIHEIGVDEVNISLDSLDSEVHDFIRNRKGVFDSVMRTIELLRKDRNGLSINIATIICDANLDTLMDLLLWCKNDDINVVTFQALFQNFGAPYNPGWHQSSDLFPKNQEKVNKVFEKLFEFKMRNGVISNSLLQLSLMRSFFNNPGIQTGRKCVAGSSDVAVDARGNMLLCFNLGPIGSLLENHPRDLFYNAESLKRRKEIGSCKRNCSLLNCNFTP